MNYTQYFAIEKRLKSTGFDFDRSDLVSQFTSGRKSGLKLLTESEYHGFIQWLNMRFGTTQIGARASGKSFQSEQLQKQRRKIIALFRKMGYEKDDKADMQRIYEWVLKSGYLKKSLNQYSASEIPKLVYQAEQFYKSYIERL
jgi:hypothetical protein